MKVLNRLNVGDICYAKIPDHMMDNSISKNGDVLIYLGVFNIEEYPKNIGPHFLNVRKGILIYFKGNISEHVCFKRDDDNVDGKV